MRPVRDFLAPAFLALALAACALLRSAEAPAPADDASQLRALLIDKYAADLEAAIDASGSCTAALAAIGVVESKYTAIWTQAHVAPAPPVVLHCPADAGFE